MSLNDRDWYRRATGAKPVEFVQLPLPRMKVTTSTRIKRALRRAVRSEWFNVGLALAVAAAAALFLSADASASPHQHNQFATGVHDHYHSHYQYADQGHSHYFKMYQVGLRIDELETRLKRLER